MRTLIALSISIWVPVALVLPLQGATIVVVPLQDASPRLDTDVAQGVTDLVANVLADRATVVKREKLDELLRERDISVKSLRDPEAAVRVGKMLGADFALTGRIVRTEGKIKFAMQLVRVSTGRAVRPISGEGPPDQLLKIGSALAGQCAEAVQERRNKRIVQLAGAAHMAQQRYFLDALSCYHAANYDLAIVNCLKVIQLNPDNVQAGLVDRPLTFRQLFTSEVTERSFAALVVLKCRGLFRPMVKLAA